MPILQGRSTGDRERTIVDRFQARVRQPPDAPAVLAADQTVTYLELNARANRLARVLAGRGVKPETFVGICLERSVDFVVALLGILKAGGACVPLDPDYPAARLQLIAQDTGDPILLTSGRLVSRLSGVGRRAVCLDQARRELSEHAPDDLRIELSGSNLAFVLYTSGSTGRPKGVLMLHQGFGNLSVVHREAFGVGPGSRVLMFGAPSHGNSIVAAVVALSTGATLCVEPYESLLPGPALLGVLKERQITHLHIPPTALAALPLEPLPSLRVLTVGGEPLPARLVDRWLTGRRVYNVYGATETNWLSFDELHRGDDTDPTPIGRPIANMEAYVVDDQMRPVPPGTPGELCVGGVGLARGYLNLPELTAERFVAAPSPTPSSTPSSTSSQGDSGALVYRTGDEALLLADGRLALLGRLDAQINIRGFRVEPGEIEAALSEHPSVAEAAVVARDKSPADQRLSAYLVLAEDGSLTVAEIRGALAEKLPAHMIPAAFVVLDRLPLLPSGKLDRIALRAQRGRALPTGNPRSRPRTETEMGLARAWASVLGVGDLGIDDDFFSLGGDSLLASRVTSEVFDAMAVEVPLRDFFEGPTIRRLARTVDRLSDTAETSRRRVSPSPAARPECVPASFQQQGLYVVHQVEPDSDAYNIAVRYRIRGPLAPEALERAIQELVRRHEILRTTFEERDGVPTQVIETWDSASLTTFLRRLPGSIRADSGERELLEECRRPFDLATGPLVRFLLFHREHDLHELIVTTHHIVADGWSLAILAEELSILYNRFTSGDAALLPELPLQFADHVLRQRRRLDSGGLDSQLSSWREQLRGAPTTLELGGGDRVAPALRGRGALHTRTISPDLAHRVRCLASQREMTLFMPLLAAFGIALGARSHQKDVLVGVPLSGRSRPDLAGLIGYFVTTLPLRVDLRGNPRFSDLMSRVRDVCVHAYSNQDVALNQLIELLRPPRSAGRAPVVQALFALQNVPAGNLRLQGCEVSQKYMEVDNVKFELEAQLWEKPDGGIEAQIRRDVGVISDRDAVGTIDLLRWILTEVVDDPGRRVDTLSGRQTA